MASGTNNNVPLLSIAMPTWNRSANLQEALMHLLPQVTPYSKQIQIIISDNGSTDDTQDVIKKFIYQYPELNIIANKNDTNLGFYGNLWKCRQLSSGKYLWVLSDDDYVCEGLIQEVIDSINISKKLAVIYLKINSTLTSFIRKRMSRDQLLAEEGYHIGLISSVIFLNEKQSDKALYEKYPTSAFLGFILLLHAFVFSRNVIVLEGNCLVAANAKPKGYNFFDIFVNHMEHVIEYMHSIQLPSNLIKIFRCRYLKNFLRQYYIIYKGEKNLKFGKFETSEISSIQEIEGWIHRSYSDLKCYWIYFYPLTFIHSFFFNSALRIRRLVLPGRKSGNAVSN